MSNIWPMVPLGEILIERQELPNPVAVETGEIPIISKISFDTGVIELRTESKTKTKMILIQPGDLVVSGINAAKGAISIFSEDNNSPAAATIHYSSYQVQKSKADISFLWWLLRSSFFRDILTRYLPGGIKTELKAKRILPIPIPLPSLSEQRRILTKIEELAAKIAEVVGLQQKVVAAGEGLIKSALKNVFEQVPISQHWNVVPLGIAARVSRGKFTHRPRNEPRFYGGDIPFIQINDISGSDRYISQYSQTLNEAGLRISRLFPIGTVVIAITGATVGVTGILSIQSCFPDSIVGIEAYPDKAIPGYVYWAVEYVKPAALLEATQTTQPNINLKILNRLCIPLPPIDEQRRIVAYLDDLQSKVDSLKVLQTQSDAELNALLPSILDKAFKGEL